MGAPMHTEIQDRAAIRELVEAWAVWRDAGDWDRFATVWHPDDGWMTATWFQGPAPDFIAISREGFEQGVSILHFLELLGFDMKDLENAEQEFDDEMAKLAKDFK